MLKLTLCFNNQQRCLAASKQVSGLTKCPAGELFNWPAFAFFAPHYFHHFFRATMPRSKRPDSFKSHTYILTHVCTVIKMYVKRKWRQNKHALENKPQTSCTTTKTPPQRQVKSEEIRTRQLQVKSRPVLGTISCSKMSTALGQLS